MKSLMRPIIILYCILLIQTFYFLAVSTRPYRIAREGRTYNMLGKNFYYPSMIRQAKDGSWGTKDTHTTRPSPVVYAQWFFVIWGKIANILSLDPVMTFIIARLTGAIVFALVIYWFCQKFLTKFYALLATLFAIALEPGPKLLALVPSWDVHVLYERRFGLPHHTYGEAFGLLFLGWWFFLLRTPVHNKTIFYRNLAITVIFAALSTIVLPSYGVLFAGISLGPMLIWSLWRKKFTHFLTIVIPPLIVIGLISIYFKLEFSKGLPWTIWNAEEKRWMSDTMVLTQYAGTLLLYYPLMILGIIGTLLRRNHLTNTLFFFTGLSLCWLIIPALLVPLSHSAWFPFANFRLLDLHEYVPAAMLSAIGVYHLANLIQNRRLRTSILIVVIGIPFAISLWLTSVYTKQIFASQNTHYWATYPSKLEWQGVLFMQQLPKNSNVMVRETYGEMLPAFGSLSVFIGGPHGFPDFLERRWLSEKFFYGTMSAPEAAAFLKTEQITHVFWGPDERWITQTPTLYPTILKPIFENNDVTVFKVK